MNRQSPLAFQFITLLVLIFICTVLGGMLSLGLQFILGIEMEAVNNLPAEELENQRYNLRWLMGLGNLFMFFIPAFLFGIFLYRKNILKMMDSDKTPNSVLFPLVFLIIITTLPLVAFSIKINQSIPVPEWVTEFGNSSQGLISAILKMETPGELFINLLIIAFIPAIGEEWIFRGIIQKKISNKINIHFAIWISAIIFSAVHFHFEGFIARMILGAILGYLFYWSGNLWVAVWGHFCNNAYAVLGQYFFSEQLPSNPEEVPEILWWQVVISLVFTVFLLFSFHRITQSKNQIKKA